MNKPTPKYKPGTCVKYVSGASIFNVIVVDFEVFDNFVMYNTIEATTKMPFRVHQDDLHDNEIDLDAHISRNIELLKLRRIEHCPSLYPGGYQS